MLVGRDDDAVLVAVSFDPHEPQSGVVQLDMSAFGLSDADPLDLVDLLSGKRMTWRRDQPLEIDPTRSTALVLVRPTAEEPAR